MYDFEISMCRRLQQSAQRDLPNIQDKTLKTQEDEIKNLKNIILKQNQRIEELEKNIK